MTAGNGHPPPLDPDLDDGADRPRSSESTKFSDQTVAARIVIVAGCIAVGVPIGLIVGAAVVWVWQMAWTVFRAAVGM